MSTHLDAGHDALVVELLNHSLAGRARLIKGLLEKNGTRNVLAKTRSGHQKLTVGPAVVFSVFDSDGVQALATRAV